MYRSLVILLIVLIVTAGIPAISSATIEPKNQKEFQRLKTIIYQHLTNRETSFKFTFVGPGVLEKSKGILEQAFQEVYDHDKYLQHSMKSYALSGTAYPNRIEMTFQMEYLTTKEQEVFVSSRVKQIVKQIIKPGMNQDEKEKVIHDYIVSHVQYDDELKEFTAYAALTKGKTVCNGYALLANKMLKEAGIENKIVSGYAVNETGYPELHAWNLVKIEGKWYHLDCTWDDMGENNEVFYPFYNLSDNEIRMNHQWSADMVPKAASSYIKELDTKKQKNSRKASFYDGVMKMLKQDAPYRETGYKFTGR